MAPGTLVPGTAWKRNVYAVTAACFMGYTGFTLSMPFLPLYIRQLGVSDVGEISMWTGLSLSVTPALTALLAPAWGRLGDRYGRKLMVERSLVSFVLIMAAMAYVARAWHVLALRVVQGLFAGYGSLSVAMAAESAPRDRMPNAIGLVQTAQRLGPGVGPVIGGVLAGLVGLRRAFVVTAVFYAAALVLIFLMYDDRATHAYASSQNPISPENPENAANVARVANERVTFRSVLAFENFILMMAVIFALQFVDRSFGPVLPLYVEQVGVAHARVAVMAGILFSIMAGAGAVGHHVCGRLLRRFTARAVIAGASGAAAASCALFGATGVAFSPQPIALTQPHPLALHLFVLSAASVLLGVGIGAAMTAAYSAAGSVIPASAHGTGFGVLTSASLIGMASSPFVAGFLGGTSIRVVFLVNVTLMAIVAGAVYKMMREVVVDQG